MRESVVQSKILALLKARGFWVIKVIAANKNGVPDIIACSPGGRFLAIEVKGPKGRLAPLQEYQLSAIRTCGGVAGVARSVSDAEVLIAKCDP